MSILIECKKTERNFYISGDNKDSLIKSPQMENFIKNNIEVLFFTDPIVSFGFLT